MSLLHRIARAQAEAAPTPAVHPLQISSRPLPGDVRVTIHVQPGAPLGMIAVEIGLGQGTRGRGLRVGDDPAVQVAVLSRIAAHVAQYARDYAQEAAVQEAAWEARLAAASALLDPCPAGDGPLL